jgi:hypothetical protein
MVLSAVIQFKTNLVLYTVESENPILTPQPDYVIDITDYLGIVEVGMLYNSETNTFEIVENE